MSGKGEILQTSIEAPALPVEIHGFTVELFAGPYPLDAKGTHRRAVYARLKPATPENQRKLERVGRTMILGEAPLEQASARALYAGELHEDDLEALGKAALKPAAALARKVVEA